MLKKIYCLFRAEPEEISGFADFVKELADGKLGLEVLSAEVFLDENRLTVTEKATEQLRQLTEAKDCLLITDVELECSKSERGICVPIAGLLDESNGGYLSYKYLFEGFAGLAPDYFVMVYSRFYGLPLDILETDRLRVREMTVEDLDRLYEIYAEPSITEYMEGLYPDKKDELEFTKSYIENMYGFYGYGLWLVIEKASGRIIGRAGLGNRDIDGETYLELGYVIAKDCQRMGYATEVSKAILDYARTELDATKVISLIKPGNDASIRTAQRLGFYKECEVTLGTDGENYLKFCKEF